MGKKHFWEDFEVGHRISIGSKLVSEEEIIEFATKFDPQYFHLDAKEAQKSHFKGLIASGWHTCCIVMKLMCDSYLLNTESMGSPGLDNVKWLQPVRPGDELEVFRTVLESKESRTKPTLGIIKFLFEAFNQNKELVFSTITVQFIGKRKK